MISKEYDEFVQVNVLSLKEGLKELKSVSQGKIKSTPAHEFLLKLEQFDES